MSDYCEHVMLDLETLGTRPGCVVLSLGACAFNKDGPQRTLYRVLSTPRQLELGLRSEPDTEAWWERQAEDARQALSESLASDRPPIQDLVAFNQFLANLGAPSTKLCVWGNGSDFDNAILLELYHTAGLKTGWRWNNNRCYRTLKSLAPQLRIERTGTYHNALDDATSQAVHAAALLTHLKRWEEL